MGTPAKEAPFSLESESAIRSQAARTLVKLFDSLYEGAVAVNRDARIVWMNDKYKALIGWNGTERVEGRPVEDVLPQSKMRRVVQTGKADLLDVFDIVGRKMVVSRLPLYDDAGEVSGALGVILYDRLQALRPIVTKFQQMQNELDAARKQLARERSAKYSFTQFVGISKAINELKKAARRAAQRDSGVLLLGETGTGKELLAHAIHAAGSRAKGPMIRVNAAAIPETLLEAELFGVAPGAFTGAERKGRPGKFELADGGTLFLDEVGDLPLHLQPKLLRVLEDGEIERLGSNRVIRVNVRIIAATSHDLQGMADQGLFRTDLFYRLNVLPLQLPPLRVRPEDIGILCEVLLERSAGVSGQPQREVSPEAMVLLQECPWDGNVRELANVLEQASAKDDALVLSPEHFNGLLKKTWGRKTSAGKSSLDVRTLKEAVAEAERIAIANALEATGGVKAKAAKMLGISRAQFYEKLNSLKLMSG